MDHFCGECHSDIQGANQTMRQSSTEMVGAHHAYSVELQSPLAPNHSFLDTA